MPEPLSTILLTMLGAKAYELIKAGFEDYIKGKVSKLFEAGEAIVSGKQDEAEIEASQEVIQSPEILEASYREATEDAYENALTNTSARMVESLGKVLQLAVDKDEMEAYGESVLRFLQDSSIADHLLETVRDLSNNALPDPEVLAAGWTATGGKELPFSGIWSLVAVNFRKTALDSAFVTPQLREVLNAQNLDQIRQLGIRLLGVQVTVKQEQYVSVMRKTFAPVHLANIAPSFVDDPGALVITDIFEPQHLRENPPPVVIGQDELEKLAREGKLDSNDEAVMTALLEESKDGESAQTLKFQRASYAEQPIRPVLDVVSPTPGKTTLAQKNRLIVITGEPGSGKTTLLRYLLLGILDPPPDPDNSGKPLAWTEGFTASGNEHFPFLIELREYHFTCEAETDVQDFMDYARYLGKTMHYGIDDHWLDQRFKQGPSLVMFDGLDEIFDPQRRDHVMKQIIGFSENYPLARIIVTSRPHGYHEGILRPAGFAHYRLQDLDREQKESFTRAWFYRVFPNSQKDAEQRIARVLNSVDRSPSVRWLAGNPLLLTIMTLIAREKELPEERAEFYEQCLDVLVHQWEVNNHLQIEDLAFLTVYRKKELLRKIAFEMQASEAGLRGNFISEEHLLEITRQWFEETYENLKGTQSEKAAQDMIQGLWHRNYILCPRGPKLYGFLHRTFMEFLTATEYVRRFEKTADFTLDDLDAVFREHGNEPEWSEVLRLICGEVGDGYAERLIRTLLTLKEFPEYLTEENLPHHLVLGIRCMGELRGLSNMEELGVFALKACLEFLECYGPMGQPEAFVRGEWLAAVNEIGDRWAGKVWLRDHEPQFKKYLSLSCFSWIEFEIYIHRDWEFAKRWLVNESPKHIIDSRSCALIAIATVWRDNRTHQLLVQYVVDGKDPGSRSKSLELLAGHVPWADDSMRALLVERAVVDKDAWPRSKSLELLAGHAPWADDATRALLVKRAVDDKAAGPRSQSLELLAGHASWADDATRALLVERAVDDKVTWLRSKSLELLASHAPWADDATRSLLVKRAVDDKDIELRLVSLELLASHDTWADHEETLVVRQRFLDKFIREGSEPKQRGEAAGLWFRTFKSSDPFADAKHNVFSEKAYGIGPYLDPHEPVSDDHLAKVASEANLTDAQRDEMIEQMNATLGWDIRVGLSHK